MKTIQVYTDDTKDDADTFKIISTIWGEAEACDSYSKSVDKIIKSNNRLGVNFKGLHSNKLRMRNWSTLGETYNCVLNKLFNYVRKGELQLQITILGKDKSDSNIKYISECLRLMLNDNSSNGIGQNFKSLDKKDLPSLYKSVNEFFVYLYYRDKFGSEGDCFEFYPDSIGSILNFKNKKYSMTTSTNVTSDLDFYSLIKILANSLSNTIRLDGWPTIKQRMTKYEPLKWSSNYMIQSCDILSNFFFSYLKYSFGIENKIFELKGKSFTNNLQLGEIKKNIFKFFELDSITNEVKCIKKDVFATIDPIVF